MNREIKFRAWDTENQEMIKPFTLLDFHGFDDGSVGIHDMTVNGGRELNEELIFLQYTGLKDKNGKEIYEGDIIEDQTGNRWEIYFDMGQFLLKNKILLNSPISLYAEPITEVIGNIYENSELFKVNSLTSE